jgi:octaprenyl-diphosphate synthase
MIPIGMTGVIVSGYRVSALSTLTICEAGEDMRTATRTLEALYAPIEADLAYAVRVFDEELVSEFAFVNEFCETVRSYRGKMLRPAFLLLTAKASGECSEKHHVLAAVVEMVHMATLVHDDVLDEAGERRQQPTVASFAGNTSAVLLGDYLISHAFHLCSGLEDQYAARRVGATTNVVCEGELLQNFHRRDVSIGESVYFDIVGRKTAALTAVACELGARYAGASPSVVDAMWRFGNAAGIAFQIVDDVLDIVGDESRVGKTLGQDLALGKLTLPTIHFLQNATSAEADRLSRILAGDDEADSLEVRALLEGQGSFDYALDRARGFVQEALAALSEVPESPSRRSLEALAGFIVDRQF